MLGGLILMGVLASLLPVGAAMVLHGLIQLTSNGYRAWLNRKDIQWPDCRYIIGRQHYCSGRAGLCFFCARPHYRVAGAGPAALYCLGLAEKSGARCQQKVIGIFAGLAVVRNQFVGRCRRAFIGCVFPACRADPPSSGGHQSGGASTGAYFKSRFLWRPGGDRSSVSKTGSRIVAAAGRHHSPRSSAPRLGKRVLDKMQDATFFSWTQRIMLSVGAVLIARALYPLTA